MDRRSTLGQIIRERRLQLGLTQEELAERIGEGVRQAEVSRLERDRIGLPRKHRLDRIAAALDLRTGELLAAAGWAGATTLDAQPDVRPEARPASEHGPDRAPGRPAPGQIFHDGDSRARINVIARNARLEAALRESRAIRSRTEVLLAESSRLAALWSRPAERRRRRPLPESRAG